MNKEAFQAYKKRISKISNAPDLRYFMTTQTDELRENEELREAFLERLEFLRINWAKDSFFKEMIENLDEDFDYEMTRESRPVDDIFEIEESETIATHFSDKFNIPRVIESFEPRNIVDVRILAPTTNLLKELETEAIRKVLRFTKQNKTQASKILGISLRTMRNKLNEYEDKGYIKLVDIETLIEDKSSKKAIMKSLRENAHKSIRSISKEVLQGATKEDARNHALEEANNQPSYKPFKYAMCHPKEFVWFDGLCFKCWQERESKNNEKLNQ